MAPASINCEDSRNNLILIFLLIRLSHLTHTHNLFLNWKTTPPGRYKIEFRQTLMRFFSQIFRCQLLDVTFSNYLVIIYATVWTTFSIKSPYCKYLLEVFTLVPWPPGYFSFNWYCDLDSQYLKWPGFTISELKSIGPQRECSLIQGLVNVSAEHREDILRWRMSLKTGRLQGIEPSAGFLSTPHPFPASSMATAVYYGNAPLGFSQEIGTRVIGSDLWTRRTTSTAEGKCFLGDER